MNEELRKEIEQLRREKTKALRARYLELFGEESKSSNQAHLFRRVAWRLQALSEGDLSQRARDLTRRIPAAKSALRRPQSAASYARRRTAPRRRLIVPGARWRDSRCIRYLTTTVLLNDNRGSEQYQSTNSSIAWR